MPVVYQSGGPLILKEAGGPLLSNCCEPWGYTDIDFLNEDSTRYELDAWESFQSGQDGYLYMVDTGTFRAVDSSSSSGDGWSADNHKVRWPNDNISGSITKEDAAFSGDSGEDDPFTCANVTWDDDGTTTSKPPLQTDSETKKTAVASSGDEECLNDWETNLETKIASVGQVRTHGTPSPPFLHRSIWSFGSITGALRYTAQDTSFNGIRVEGVLPGRQYKLKVEIRKWDVIQQEEVGILQQSTSIFTPSSSTHTVNISISTEAEDLGPIFQLPEHFEGLARAFLQENICGQWIDSPLNHGHHH